MVQRDGAEMIRPSADTGSASSGVPEVLFLTYGLSIGGAETVLVNLLNAFDDGLFKPIIASLAGPSEMETRLRMDLEVLHFPRRSRFDAGPARGIARLIDERSIRTVLTLGMFSYLFLRRTLKTHRSLRVFLWLHTTRPRTLKEFLQTLAYARIVRSQDLMISVCESQAAFLSRLYAIPRKKFRTIYNGVDMERWVPPLPSFDRSAFRRKLGVPDDAPVILQVAQFRPEKHQDDSVRALAQLRSDGTPDPFLVFVGGGEEALQSRTRALAEELGVLDRVRFCGKQTDVLPYYWASDLFTLSSVSETFPMTILEAMATGLPCVMTDVGGARELIQEGRNGFVSRPADPRALAAAWKNTLDRLETWDRTAIRDRTQRLFSFDACVRGFECLLSGEAAQ